MSKKLPMPERPFSWLAGEMSRLDVKLVPGLADERLVRSQIAVSHERRNGVVLLDLGRKGIRAPLFERLTALSLEWGPLKSERAKLAGHTRWLEKQIERLEKIIASEKRKKARRAHGAAQP